MTDIVAFLRDRLDEDQRAAEHDQAHCDAGAEVRYASGADFSPALSRVLLYQRFGPARVLREVAAKQALIKRLDEDAAACADDAEWRGVSAVEWQVLVHLAAAYATHPDYDLAWRVE